jgi:hypothetical protein
MVYGSDGSALINEEEHKTGEWSVNLITAHHIYNSISSQLAKISNYNHHSSDPERHSLFE